MTRPPRLILMDAEALTGCEGRLVLLAALVLVAVVVGKGEWETVWLWRLMGVKVDERGGAESGGCGDSDRKETRGRAWMDCLVAIVRV